MEVWRPKTRIKGPKGIPVFPSFDRLLGNGIPVDVITEIYGPPSSGKSNIAIVASVNAIKAGYNVAYLDPEGSFHLGRVEQVAGDWFDKVIENVHLVEPESLEHQTHLIRNIVGRDYKLVIVDPVTYHYRLELDRLDPEPANKELARQMALLSWHARKRSAAVLVTNQIYSNMRGGYEPLAKEVMGYNAKVRVELGVDGIYRTARLVKHVSKRTGSTIRFRITGDGLI